MLYKKSFIVLMSIIICFAVLSAADKDAKHVNQLHKSFVVMDPVVENDWKYHKIGTLWSRVTNFGKTGDDAYTDRTPSGDWPGGSGN
jgi:hypothetical protein